VLRLSDFSETSQIVSLFTARAGLVRLIAKGVRRGTRSRIAVGLDLLEYGDVGYVPPRGDAGLGTLTEWVQRDAFAGLRAGLPRLYGGLYAAERIVSLTEEYDAHSGLFRALRALLEALSAEDSVEPTGELVRFQVELLADVGFSPQLEHCVNCRRTPARAASVYFSSTAGGLICRDCEMHYAEKRVVPRTLIGRQPPDGDAREWFALFDAHLTHVGGGPAKTAERILAGRRTRL
jgi:DNA repair protein RecO (recombination protein O)